MKRLVALALVLILLPVSRIYGASPALMPKPGTKCKSVGSTFIDNGIKMSCIKKGSSLVWGKAVRIKVPPSTAPVEPSIPKQTPSPTNSFLPKPNLTLDATIEPTGSLRLELREDVYLGHCASFLVYRWGVADSYEGVFYRQNKHYSIPLGSMSLDDLPLSFTFDCDGYEVQSYSITWTDALGKKTPLIERLRTSINPSTVKNALPPGSDSVPSGFLRMVSPRPEDIARSLIPQPDGRYATETTITYFASFPRDICLAKIYKESGELVPLRPYGPGVGYTYMSNRVKISGFDRLHSIGYVSYRSSYQGTMKLEVNCQKSGTLVETFIHPAPTVALHVVEDGPCPTESIGTSLPSLKSASVIMHCVVNGQGGSVWSSNPRATPKPNPSPESTANPTIGGSVRIGATCSRIGSVARTGTEELVCKKVASGDLEWARKS